jgi:hypothetical protein
MLAVTERDDPCRGVAYPQTPVSSLQQEERPRGKVFAISAHF